ncbi:MAG: flagellar hook capping FlgD N-terminal domain-containing protein [Actinomycetota bacterium]
MNINANLAANLNASSLSTTKTTGKTDSNMFMTLLVAQLKNQDPLQPQDGAAFVAQLAQFNSLDNLIGIRQAMEQLLASINRPVTPTAPTAPTAPPTTSTNPGSPTDS